jgi:MFS transporter, putative metabolite:H+ symporter
MKPSGTRFHHPVAFWLGTIAIAGGVCAHFPMFAAAREMHYRMAGMPVDAMMIAGMSLILAGLAASVYGVVPRRAAPGGGGRAISLHVADNAPLTNAHGRLLAVLIVALIVDIMKPATLGFVVPGMSDEYEITRETATLLAFTALIGTALGSVIWGLIADAIGRRSAILISSLLFVGTAVCGSMPAFEWNLFMCFLMGASAGGLLPIAFTLMAETVPARHRGWLLVLLGGMGTTGGYLAAAGCAAWLEPQFGWRVLWYLNLPTGLLLILLNRYLPESPRFLAHIGRNDEARGVLARYGVAVIESPGDTPLPVGADQLRAMPLLFGRHIVTLTIGLVLCGIAWGLVNFGFLLWLPSHLRSLGFSGGAGEALLARSAFLALPGALLVTWLYHRWSTIRTLALFTLLTALALVGFYILGSTRSASPLALGALTIALLVSVSGVIAMLIPYATEIYPVQVRGTGSGVVAGASKLGGIAASGLGVLGAFASLAGSALALAIVLALSAAVLLARGIETRGRSLEDIHAGIAGAPARK